MHVFQKKYFKEFAGQWITSGTRAFQRVAMSLIWPHIGIEPDRVGASLTCE
jgi:hypothetical protein